MMLTFLSAPAEMMKAAVWVFLVVVPLIWLDDHLKVRRVLRGELSFREQRDVEEILAELKSSEQAL